MGNVLLAKARDKLTEDADAVADSEKPLKLADIRCERRLGGVLKHYYRAAA